MTPKEKAKELIANFYWELENDYQSKICALIAVDEILNEYWSHDTKRRDWWQEVKQEIKKL